MADATRVISQSSISKVMQWRGGALTKLKRENVLHTFSRQLSVCLWDLLEVAGYTVQRRPLSTDD